MADMTLPSASSHLRLARPSRDLTLAEEFWVEGLGLEVLYLDGPVDEELTGRLIRHGGTPVPARNPYWDNWGVAIADPDGYRLVLSHRGWA